MIDSVIMRRLSGRVTARFYHALQCLQDIRCGFELLAVDVGKKFFANGGCLLPDGVVTGDSRFGDHHVLDAPIRGGGLAARQSRFHQAIDHGHHGRAFHAELVREFGL